MPKPKMRTTAPDRVQHFVIIEIDGQQEEVLVADESAAQALAEIDKLGLAFARDDGLARQQSVLHGVERHHRFALRCLGTSALGGVVAVGLDLTWATGHGWVQLRSYKNWHAR